VLLERGYAVDFQPLDCPTGLSGELLFVRLQNVMGSPKPCLLDAD
jgi:hypothetical protein